MRLHSSLDYIAPLDFMNGLSSQIWAERDRRLHDARRIRAQRRTQLHSVSAAPLSPPMAVACA